MAVEHCGPKDINMALGDEGLNAWRAQCHLPARSAFQGALTRGRLRWCPRAGLSDLTLDRILRPIKEDRSR